MKLPFLLPISNHICTKICTFSLIQVRNYPTTPALTFSSVQVRKCRKTSDRLMTGCRTILSTHFCRNFMRSWTKSSSYLPAHIHHTHNISAETSCAPGQSPLHISLHTYITHTIYLQKLHALLDKVLFISPCTHTSHT